MLKAITEANRVQGRSLEALNRRLDAEARETRMKEDGQAALLGEARRALAEQVAAPETEKRRREAAERCAAELQAAVALVRAALARLPVIGAPDANCGALNDSADAFTGGVSSKAAEVVVEPAREDVAELDDPAGVRGAPDVMDGDACESVASAKAEQVTLVVVALAGDEVASLGRIARRRGMSREAFVADLIRRELRRADLGETGHGSSQAARRSGPVAPGLATAYAPASDTGVAPGRDFLDPP